MPELPELEVLKDNLKGKVLNKRVKELSILKPYILKNLLPDNLSEEVVEDMERRGKYLVISLSQYKIVLHLMIKGKLRFYRKVERTKKSVAAYLSFDDRSVLEISEVGSKKRASLYLFPRDAQIDRIDMLGIDPLKEEFTLERLVSLLKREKKKLKSLLCNQRIISGIGNAYADEILWKAKLSPFRITSKLTEKEIEDLYKAIKEILSWAIDEIRQRIEDGLDIKERRSFLNIHGKKGEPCPRCNTRIEWVSFAQTNTYYCPSCQTKGRILKDRRSSKFLK